MTEETQATQDTGAASATPAPRGAGKAAAPKRKTLEEMRAASSKRGAVCLALPKHGETVDITLHDTDEIPPTGQFVGVNGEAFILKPNVRYTVPKYLLGALDNAVTGKPVTDKSGAVIGYRQVTRFPYTVHKD